MLYQGDAAKMALVLIVDDDPTVLRMLTQVMQRDGHTVMQAEDGDVAMRLFRRQPADIIITDLLMPNKEGLELIAEAREIAPAVGIIAYSGGGKIQPENYLEFATGMGADRVFTKPVPITDLSVAVKELLASREAV
jgi:DNA-binding response OmpR family regulator